MSLVSGTLSQRFRWVICLAPLALGGCGGNLYLAGTEPRAVECAPYARELTGMELGGEAYRWWDEANGLYARSQTPAAGAALVFRRSWTLPAGHVAVVDKILSAREILVNQANWIHDRISHDDEVRDVSAYNDWTLVRVWWRPTGSLGVTLYPTYGFVGPRALALAELDPGPNRSLQDGDSSAICGPVWTEMATSRKW